MPQEIRVSYVLTPREVGRAARWKHKLRVRWLIRFLLGVLGFFIGMAGVAGVLTDEHWAVGLIPLALGLTLLFLTTLEGDFARFCAWFDRDLPKPFEWVVSRRGLRLETGSEVMVFDWDRIAKVVETRQGFLIYTTLENSY